MGLKVAYEISAVRSRQIAGIYVSFVCGALLHFRIGFPAIIDVFYIQRCDAVACPPADPVRGLLVLHLVVSSRLAPLSGSTALHCSRRADPSVRRRVVRQILRSPGTRKRIQSPSPPTRRRRPADLYRLSSPFNPRRTVRRIPWVPVCLRS